MTDSQNVDARITELEMRITFQDSTIEELNREVTEVRKQLDSLVKRVGLLTEQLKVSYVTNDKDTKPPHY